MILLPDFRTVLELMYHLKNFQKKYRQNSGRQIGSMYNMFHSKSLRQSRTLSIVVDRNKTEKCDTLHDRKKIKNKKRQALQRREAISKEEKSRYFYFLC